MKKFGLLFVVVLSLTFSLQISAQNVSPHFSELKGMEDAQGNTHLFYRIFSSLGAYPYPHSSNNSIYHFDLEANTDTFFLYEGGSSDILFNSWKTVDDYSFWNNDPSKYIYCGSEIGIDGIGYIKRYDQGNGFYYGFGGFNIDISRQNDSLIFVNLGQIFISTDGGITWDEALQQSDFNFISLSAFNDNVMYGYNPPGKLLKSIDRGINYSVVDTFKSDDSYSTKFYYDIDETHLYRINRHFLQHYLSASDNQGDPFSWSNKYLSNNPIFFSNDESQSGAIYLADGNKIFYSSNYGNTFNLYKELDKKIIGIYKKPNSDKLYAATKYKLYEISNNSIAVIKTLPIPTEVLDFYPLHVGNKWIYERLDYSIDWITGTPIIDTSYFQRKVIGLEVKPNGKKYYKINDYDFYNKVTLENFERIDSSTGIVYRFDATLDSTNFECIIDDLMLEQGNLFNTSRLYPGYNPIGMIFENEDYFNDWSLYRKRNGFSGGAFGAEYYSLTQGIGLDSVFVSLIDAFDAYIDLKGCVIDGTVYGDTTLTDIDGCIELLLPTHFVLEQNYPNPFNPSTKINWQSPVAGIQSIRVYDVLGNEVATLVNEFRNAGIYEVDFDASKLSSGVYFYQLKSGEFIQTKKMILIK